MKFTIQREALLEPLQSVCGVVERRQTSAILSNILLVAESNQLVMTGTDQEVELVAMIQASDVQLAGEVTVPARKLVDICRSLPDGALLTASLEGNRVSVSSGRFNSHLATMPVGDFPEIEFVDPDVSISITGSDLLRLLQRTSFAMAQQDVRYFFNGVLLDVQDKRIRFVATNGQRLATSYLDTNTSLGNHQFILPRKAVGELSRMATSVSDANQSQVILRFSPNHMRCEVPGGRLTTRLIDATYPDYTRAIPTRGDKVMMVDRVELKEALSRTAILSNELYRNVRLMLSKGKLDMHANNPLQEEAEESIAVDYNGPPLEIGFNVSYLIEALSVIQGQRVRLTLSEAGSACLLEDIDEPVSAFVISPMVL